MKKFFSLVLALVMALSLTTVAWGAPTTVDVTSKAQLADVLKNTAAQEVVINLSETPSDGTHYIIDLYSNPTVNASIKSLTINGTGTTKVSFDDLQVNAALFSQLTINKCEILHMNTKNWGHLVFGSSGSTGVYTVSNCIFNGVGTTGIYTNPRVNGESFVIDNCTFNGDFGTEGAIVVQNGNGTEASTVSTSLTVSNNTFNNLASEAVAVWWKDSDLDVTSQVSVVAMVNNADQFKTAVAAADAGETIKLMGNVDLTATPVEITTPVTIDDNGKTLTGLAAGSDITTDANGKITGGTFADLAAAAPYLAPGYTVATDVNGNPVVLAGTNVPAAVAKGAYYTTNLTTLAVYPSCDLSTYTYTLEPYTAAADTAKIFATVAIWQTHKITGAKTIAYTAVVASADSANLAFVNGASVTYLNTNVSTWNATATKVATVDVEDAEKCGDVFIAGDVGVYKDAADKVYYEDIGGVAYNVGGQLVLLKEAAKDYPVVDSAALKAALATPAAGTVYTVAHDYDCDYTTFNGKKTVTKVYCAECDAQFAFVAGKVSDAIAKFGAGNYLPTALVDAAGTVYVSVVPAGTVVVPTTPSTGKVESAATFDAGIAMYVGMSVLAATGSAVVLKKRER